MGKHQSSGNLSDPQKSYTLISVFDGRIRFRPAGRPTFHIGVAEVLRRARRKNEGKFGDYIALAELFMDMISPPPYFLHPLDDGLRANYPGFRNRFPFIHLSHQICPIAVRQMITA